MTDIDTQLVRQKDNLIAKIEELIDVSDVGLLATANTVFEIIKFNIEMWVASDFGSTAIDVLCHLKKICQRRLDIAELNSTNSSRHEIFLHDLGKLIEEISDEIQRGKKSVGRW